VLLARGPGAHELFLVRRADGLRFFGGFHAFPGGRVHRGDREHPAGTDAVAAARGAAARELFEETGVLLARRPDRTFPPSDDALAAARRDLLAETVTWPGVLAALGAAVDPGDLRYAGSLVTPAFAPVRFDTAFFVADLPPGQRAEVWPGELVGGLWDSADGILRAWTAGGLLVSPPSLSLLEAIRGRPVEELPSRLGPLLEQLATGALPPVWFAPAVAMIPLRTAGLPPSTHTNAYLVGTDFPYLLDPGPPGAEEQGRLFEALDGYLGPRRLAGVLLSHHHSDHVGAAAACARRYGAPVLAHAWTAEKLAGEVALTRLLGDGERLPLGEGPAGAPWHLEALLTPGHTPGHLVFFEPRYGLLFSGDMVSTLSSVVIAPPEGDLALYLDSLRRLRGLPARLLLPAHGPPSSRPAFVLDEYLEHRRQREEQLLAALGDEPRTAAELAAVIYPDLAEDLRHFAELQILAGLIKLEREGRAAAVPAQPAPRWRRPRV
jgi:glyoxylase-like metal-dependent hydrolase (beta-lactamase superfamily II)/8-oxo-dGTP pyrophosphatase MutT (NUDIX family)